MIIIAARCPFCGQEAPLSCKTFEISLPPRTMNCEKCQKELDTGEKFRANWLAVQLRKILFVLLIIFFLGSAQGAKVSLVFMIVLSIVLSGIVSYIAAPLLIKILSPMLKWKGLI